MTYIVVRGLVYPTHLEDREAIREGNKPAAYETTRVKAGTHIEDDDIPDDLRESWFRRELVVPLAVAEPVEEDLPAPEPEPETDDTSQDQDPEETEDE